MPLGMVLAAGLGTRLRPLTLELPKAVVPVAGRPAAGWALAAMARAGVTEVVVNLHHLGDSVQHAIGDGSRFGVRVRYSREPGAILGTGGGIRRGAEMLGAEAMLVANADVVTDLDLGELLAHHQRSGAAATLVLVPHPQLERYGAACVDGAGRVVEIAGRRIAGSPARAPDERAFVFAGIHVLGRAALAMLPGQGCIVRSCYFEMLERAVPISAYVYDRGYWSDIGTPAEYLACSLDIVRGRAGVLAPDITAQGTVLVEPGARVEGGAVLLDDVQVCAGSVVEAGARLERCIVWPGARARGSISNAIVTSSSVVTVPA